MPYNPIMPNNRLLLPTIVVAAILPLAALAQDPFGLGPGPETQAPAKAEPRTPTEAEAAIDAALDRLQAVETYAAKIEVSAQMLSQGFAVKGLYLKAADNRVLLRLDVEGLGDISARLHQVSDGRTLWEYSQILDTRYLSKLSLTPVLETINRSEVDPELREQWLTGLGFGGPEALVAGLRRTVHFNLPVEEVEADGRTLLVFRGEWEDRAALGLPGGQGLPANQILPAYVPKHVELRLDKEDGWPHQLLLRGEVPSAIGPRMIDPSGRAVARKVSGNKDKPTEIRLAYVRQDRTPELTEFEFQPPPGVDVIDNTEQIVAGLQAQVAEAAARRRSDAAGESSDLLDAPLTAPLPDPVTPPGPAPAPENFRSSVPPRS